MLACGHSGSHLVARSKQASLPPIRGVRVASPRDGPSDTAKFFLVGAGRGAVVASEPTKEYVLKSMLPARLRREWVDQPEELAERGFCVTVCALVSIAGGKIEEDALWKHLRALGVHPEDEAHPKLGNARAALARLQKRRYLIRERLGRDEERGEEKYALALAERALDELGQEGVDAFVQEVMRGENEDDQGEEDQGGTTNNGEGRE